MAVQCNRRKRRRRRRRKKTEKDEEESSTRSAALRRNKMATKQTTDANTNIPDYEYIDVNSKAFHIGSFRNEWLDRLKPCDVSYQQEDEETLYANLAKEMCVSAETMAELKSVCSLDSLRCHPEDQPPDPDVVPPDPTLKTLVQRKKRQDYKASLKFNKNRHDLYADELERLTVGRRSEEVADMVPEGEVILTVNVYYPAIFKKFNYVRPHMTLLMTGSHSLADLRDAICCVSDLQVCGEFSNTPDMAPDFISKDHFKSAFFFFEGVFYNDMRFSECQDISMTTIEWAKSHNFPPYTQAKMEETQLVDLKVKVGFPYLYCHQGDCEHLVIITDVRLLLFTLNLIYLLLKGAININVAVPERLIKCLFDRVLIKTTSLLRNLEALMTPLNIFGLWAVGRDILGCILIFGKQ